MAITPDVFRQLKKELSGLPKKIEVPLIKPQMKLLQVKGCRDCNFTGYKGRTGIFEAFFVDDAMEKFILTSPSIAEIRERAIKKGMVLMRKDGLMKVLQGVTTIDEVDRVTEK